jgi:hypothetical protein
VEPRFSALTFAVLRVCFNQNRNQEILFVNEIRFPAAIGGG